MKKIITGLILMFLLSGCSSSPKYQAYSDNCTIIDELTLPYLGSIHYTLSAQHPSGAISSESNAIILKAFSLENGYTLLKKCKIGSFTNNPNKYDMYYSSRNKPFNGYDKKSSYRNTVYDGIFTEQTGIYAINSKSGLINLISEDINSNQCWRYPVNFSGGNLNRVDNFWTYFCPKLGLINNIDKIIKQRSTDLYKSVNGVQKEKKPGEVGVREESYIHAFKKDITPEVSHKIDIYGFAYKIKRAQANGTIEGRTKVISNLAIGKYSSGNIDTLIKNKDKVKKHIKIECRSLAIDMKSEFFKYSKFENIYSESLSYCVKYATDELFNLTN